MTPASLLAIAEDVTWLPPILEWLRKRGMTVHLATTAAGGVELHKTRDADMILVGLPLPDATASHVLGALLAADPDAAIVVVGVDAEVATVAKARAFGATAYYSDVPDRSDLLFALGRSLGRRQAGAPVRLVREREAATAAWSAIVGGSPAMKQALDKLRQICDRTLTGAAPTVLLAGEVGTGRGLLARALHYNSVRRHRPFVEVNCTSSQLERALFGTAARPGAFETADTGTLFLEEIASVPSALQARLVTAIDERVVARDGAHPSKLDLQVVASTRRDLGAMVRAGELRSDLYHRLSVVTVEVPPLRDRGDDLDRLADRMLAQIAAAHGFAPPQLSPAARTALRRHEWPGNARELRAELERLVLLVDADVIEDRHVHLRDRRSEISVVHDDGRVGVAVAGDTAPLEEIERELIRLALEKSGGNVSRAARYLAITRQTMLYRMKKHGFASPSTPDLTGSA